ncbi:MAG: polyprenyl synthetase family protein, partial [Bacteroidales bacterium]|nr:polyprenyl synthetase family protein [Bacteroidales bacterium]
DNYLYGTSGKQIRPLLSLLSARLFGKACDECIYCAAISEMIHTATLLHDDVADDGNIRRGKPTVKAKYNLASSILAGDYWLAKALKLLVGHCSHSIMDCFTNTVIGLAEGEFLQMLKSETLDTTESDYYKVISHKTSALFVASMKSSAIAAGAGEKEIEAVSTYAYNYGLAFQIRDDIFDYSPSLDTGKKAGSDLEERKITLPLLCAFENCTEDEEKAVRKMISQINENVSASGDVSGADRAIINRVNEFIYENEGVESAQKKLDGIVRAATDALFVLPAGKARDFLRDLADNVGKRNK